MLLHVHPAIANHGPVRAEPETDHRCSVCLAPTQADVCADCTEEALQEFFDLMDSDRSDAENDEVSHG